MSKIIDALLSWGCDIDGAMERFMDDEELYLSCLSIVCDDDAFAELESALRAHDIPAAFDAAHTLKGVLGNMGLTPMYDAVVEIVEPLRAGNDDGCLERCRKLFALCDRLRAITKLA
ncbi:MAG: Hpt domain-containing protein [Eubacteriales bacterium]